MLLFNLEPNNLTKFYLLSPPPAGRPVCDGGHYGVNGLLTATAPPNAVLLLLLKVLQPVLRSVPLAIRGAGEGGGAGHLTHGAQGVGLLGGRGLVSPGYGGINHSVGTRHHLELFGLTHLTTAEGGHQSSLSIWVFISPHSRCSL